MPMDKYAVKKAIINPKNKCKKLIEFDTFVISIIGIVIDTSITGIDKSIENFAASTLFKPTILEPE